MCQGLCLGKCKRLLIKSVSKSGVLEQSDEEFFEG